MAKNKKDECEKGAPLWVVTYGDLMSLLLTFFILLLSFATMDKPREVQEAMISIKGAFGVLPRELTTVRINPIPVRMRRPNKKVEDLGRRVQRALQVAGLQQDIKLTYDAAGGLKITLPGQMLYRRGETRIRPEAFALLENIGAMLSDLPETFFEIRGHTDNTALSSDVLYRDNHDLSGKRADAVARFMNRNAGIPLDRFEIIACGSGQPIATNTTEEGRSANRRVDIYVRGLMDSQQVVELKGRVDELTKRP
ncbi:MAG: flagellar motor protein MotB [Candidatus Hydrogenedentes bacterium]|nr:flagellar motor protein MotB [Candidatus Hydrogenedentota bacterium]